VQLIICDDHLMFAEALSSLFAKRGHEVLARPSTPEAAIALADRDDVDAWLIDLHFPGRSPAEVLRRIRSASPAVPIVVLTADCDRSSLQAALANGADGVALKTDGIDEVERLLCRVRASPFRGRKQYSQQAWSKIEGTAARQASPSDEPQFTARERDVLTRLYRGESTASIAASLGVGVSTVRTHLQHLFRKSGVHSRLELVAFAARSGLVNNARPAPRSAAGAHT